MTQPDAQAIKGGINALATPPTTDFDAETSETGSFLSTDQSDQELTDLELVSDSDLEGDDSTPQRPISQQPRTGSALCRVISTDSSVASQYGDDELAQSVDSLSMVTPQPLGGRQARLRTREARDFSSVNSSLER